MNSLDTPEEVLNVLGIPYSKGQTYLSLCCPFHGDKNPSSIFYRKDPWFRCFSCGVKYSLDVFYTKLSGKVLERPAPSLFSEQKKEVKKDYSQLPVSWSSKDGIEIRGDLLPVTDVPGAQEYCSSRGLTQEFLDVFGVSATRQALFNKKTYYDRVCIPIVEKDVLLSVEGRDYTRRQDKKVLYPKDGSVNTLFNLDALDRKKTLIVVEGVMDLPRIWSHVTKNVTSTFGIQLTYRQKHLLHEFEDVVFFIDDDEAGLKPLDQFEDAYRDFDFKVTYVPGKDPGASSLREIYRALSSAKPLNLFLMEKFPIFREESFSLF